MHTIHTNSFIFARSPISTIQSMIINRVNAKENSAFARLLIISGKLDQLIQLPREATAITNLTIFWPSDKEVNAWLEQKNIHPKDLQKNKAKLLEFVEPYIIPYGIDPRWNKQCQKYISYMLLQRMGMKRIKSLIVQQEKGEVLIDIANAKPILISPIGISSLEKNLSCKELLEQNDWSYIYFLK